MSGVVSACVLAVTVDHAFLVLVNILLLLKCFSYNKIAYNPVNSKGFYWVEITLSRKIVEISTSLC